MGLPVLVRRKCENLVTDTVSGKDIGNGSFCSPVEALVCVEMIQVGLLDIGKNVEC